MEKFISKILKEFTDIIEFKFNELTLTDEIAQSQILERYVKNQIMLPNEAREILDLPQAAHGDTPLQLNAKAAGDAMANGNRARDAERTNNASDTPATVAGRNPKGEGRSSQ